MADYASLIRPTALFEALAHGTPTIKYVPRFSVLISAACALKTDTTTANAANPKATARILAPTTLYGFATANCDCFQDASNGK